MKLTTSESEWDFNLVLRIGICTIFVPRKRIFCDSIYFGGIVKQATGKDLIWVLYYTN